VGTLTKKLSWDQYFLHIAYAVAQRSECLDKQVGCVIVDKFKRIIGTGYNGFPAGTLNPCKNNCIKEHGKPCGMVHAELNAMLYTDISRADTMYLTLPPCSDCLKHIESTPINTVVLPVEFKGSPKTRELMEYTELACFVDPELDTNPPMIRTLLEAPSVLGIGIAEAFLAIKDYHEVLGYPGETKTQEELLKKFRELIVALYQEVSELCDSFPWKPWREIKDQTFDEENAIMEMVDIFFFMGSILELFEISPERFEETLQSKIAENYDRIQRGYNKPKEDM
jgi:dCMP deaminase